MINENAIIIMPVANGFAVTTPSVRERGGIYPINPDLLNNMISKIKMPGSDDVLDKIQRDVAEEEKKQEQKEKENDIDTFRESNIHVFATLDLALEFISNKYRA